MMDVFREAFLVEIGYASVTRLRVDLWLMGHGLQPFTRSALNLPADLDLCWGQQPPTQARKRMLEASNHSLVNVDTWSVDTTRPSSFGSGL